MQFSKFTFPKFTYLHKQVKNTSVLVTAGFCKSLKLKHRIPRPVLPADLFLE